MRAHALSGAALAGIVATAAVPAYGQEAAEGNGGLEEIVVTAQHRSRR
jgi:hypothetical protein